MIDRVAMTANRILGRFDDVVWILGEGRSGTTWATSLLDPPGRLRVVFEPFHPHRTPELADLAGPYAYARPGDRHPRLEAVVDKIFSGRLLSPRTMPREKRWLYDGLVVKDIFANLIAAWTVSLHPEIRPVLLLRHPIAVAKSKLALDDWFWFREPVDLLADEALLEDHLSPFEAVIHDARTQLEKYVALWCISTLIPLKMMQPEQLVVIHYEVLRSDPHGEAARLATRLGRPDPDQSMVELVAQRPSRTSRSHEGVQQVARTDDLTEGIEPIAFQRAMGILDRFGLTGLYGGTSMPDPSVAVDLLSQEP